MIDPEMTRIKQSLDNLEANNAKVAKQFEAVVTGFRDLLADARRAMIDAQENIECGFSQRAADNLCKFVKHLETIAAVQPTKN